MDWMRQAEGTIRIIFDQPVNPLILLLSFGISP